MAQDDDNGGRVDLRLDTETARQLDALCAQDVRNRQLQLRWLIGQEHDRRHASVVQLATAA